MLNRRQMMQTRHRSGLPFTFINTAISADGKIAPSSHNYIPFGSDFDKELLLEIRTRADAVMTGARTVEAFPLNLGPGPSRFRQKRKKLGRDEYNLRVIVSGHASVDPKAEIFRHKFSPIIVLACEAAPQRKLKALAAAGAILHVTRGSDIDFKKALHWLHREWNVNTLLCEGGGGVNGSLFDAGLVDELYLTICPVIIGGRSAPTLADACGVKLLRDATQMQLKSKKRIGDEMFLRYLVQRK